MEAKLKKRRVGRPRLTVDLGELKALRQRGLSLRRIAQECGVGKDTVRNTLKTLSKNSQETMNRGIPDLSP